MSETATGDRVEKRARRKRADWIPEIQRWRASGQDAEAYASAHGLHPRTLAWWARQLEGSSGAKQGSGAKRGVAKPSAKFLPARISDLGVRSAAEAVPERHEVEVVLRNGRRVRVGREFQLEALARLLDAVEAGGSC
jgi:hypothetical protein